MTTVRHVSKCCSLGYSFNFSHKCPELVVPSSRFSSRLQSYGKTRITMLITALHSGQLPPSSATRRAHLRVRRAPRQSLRWVPTNILHNTVMVCLLQLAFLVPTLRPTRWQQSVSTARESVNSSSTPVGSVYGVMTTFIRQKNVRQYCGSMLETYVYRVTVSSLLYSSPSLTSVKRACCLLTSSPSFSSPSFSSPANSTSATSSVIFHSCKFQSCKFSYPEFRVSAQAYVYASLLIFGV